MSTIHIVRKHKKSATEAKAAVNRVAKSIAKKFDVTHDWDGDTLHFERTGVHGSIALTKGQVTVTAKLGLLLFAIKGPVENAVNEYLDREFGD